MPVPDISPVHEVPISGSATSVANGQFGYIRAPYAGRVMKVASSIGTVIAAGDATVTTSIAGTAIPSGVFTISLAGTVIGDQDSVAVNAPCAEGDSIRFAFTGSGTGGGPVNLYAYVRRGG